MSALSDDLLKGADEAAAYLGLPRRAVYRMVETGDIPVIRKGALLFFRKSQIDEAFGSGGLPAAVRSAGRVAASQSDDGACDFNQLMPLFQYLFEPNSNRLLALSSRVKHLIRLGATPHALRGRGKRSRFLLDDVWELLVLMALTEAGVSPEKAISLYAANVSRLRVGLYGYSVDAGYVVITFNARTMLQALRHHLPQFFTGPTVVDVQYLHANDCPHWDGGDCACREEAPTGEQT
jgi:excisionase family DNA binding protein